MRPTARTALLVLKYLNTTLRGIERYSHYTASRQREQDSQERGYLSVRSQPLRDPLRGVRPTGAALTHLTPPASPPARPGRGWRSSPGSTDHALDVLADPPKSADVSCSRDDGQRTLGLTSVLTRYQSKRDGVKAVIGSFRLADLGQVNLHSNLENSQHQSVYPTVQPNTVQNTVQ